ncbi:L,D-transpeptidase family protein [Sphingomonas folli]|uniref:L,D-transpeptidase family protein n=1 Tax=Sphingomonas folli TaxID=2862497 RepID=UPI00358DBEC4
MSMRLNFLLTAAAVLAPAAAVAQAPAAPPPLDRDILHVQVILDHLGFAPGILDGRGGQSLQLALRGFQESRGLPETGKPDAATMRALYPYRAARPTVTIRLTADMVRGPFLGAIPHGYDKQAELPTLGYRSPMEKLAEMFHTTPAVLMALNSPATRIAQGATVTFPNALPSSRAYPADVSPEWRQTLTMLNVDGASPKGESIVVDKSEGSLRVLDKAGKLVAQFPVTTGSEHDPLPLGTWTIKGKDYNPKFHYNPALFWDAKKNDKKTMLPPGPNGPVGVVWIDLSKDHYGIHGTPEPSTIGRSESHGCIRMANWDVARLTLMLSNGAKAVFQA